MPVIPRIGETPVASSVVGTAGTDNALASSMGSIASAVGAIGGVLARHEREAERLAEEKRRQLKNYQDSVVIENHTTDFMLGLETTASSAQTETEYLESAQKLSEQFMGDDPTVNSQLTTRFGGMIRQGLGDFRAAQARRMTENTLTGLLEFKNKMGSLAEQYGANGNVSQAIASIKRFDDPKVVANYNLYGKDGNNKRIADRDDVAFLFLANMSENNPIEAERVSRSKTFAPLLTPDTRTRLDSVIEQNKRRLQETREFALQNDVYTMGGDIIRKAYSGTLGIAELARQEQDLKTSLTLADDTERPSIEQQLGMVKTARKIASNVGVAPLFDDNTLVRLNDSVLALSEEKDVKNGLKIASKLQSDILAAMDDRKISSTQAKALQQSLDTVTQTLADKIGDGFIARTLQSAKRLIGIKPEIKAGADEILQLQGTELGKRLTPAQKAQIYLDYFNMTEGAEALTPEQAVKASRYSLIKTLGMTPKRDGFYEYNGYTVHVKEDGTWEDAPR